MIDERWTSAVAVAVAVSFALAAPLNARRFELYRRVAAPYEDEKIAESGDVYSVG